MSIATSIVSSLSAFVDDVAIGLTHLRAVLRPARRVQLIEQTEGAFLAVECRAGATEPLGEAPLRLEQGRFAGPMTTRTRTLLARSQVEVVLAPSRFVFRPLELPRGADKFLDGIVRSQIDRLTPWSANQAVFGWSPPLDAGPNRTAVIVAATAHALIDPIEQALIEAGVDRISMSTRAEDEAELVIPVFAQRSASEDVVGRLRQGLIIGLSFAGVAFAISLGAWIFVGGAYDARLAELQKGISERRAALMDRPGGAAEQALQALQAKKRATPSAVMTLEELSKMLPDDTHLSELRMEDGKVQLVGLSGDAPALIQLIEQSQRFLHATFFAPTVRGPDGRVESFHIEAQLQPSFAVPN